MKAFPSTVSNKTILQRMIVNLNDAMTVCLMHQMQQKMKRRKDYTKEWCYAVGYSRSCMKDVIAHLELIVEELEYGGTDNT